MFYSKSQMPVRDFRINVNMSVRISKVDSKAAKNLLGVFVSDDYFMPVRVLLHRMVMVSNTSTIYM